MSEFVVQVATNAPAGVLGTTKLGVLDLWDGPPLLGRIRLG